MNRKESEFIQSLAYHRDSCSKGFDLLPKQEKIREVLIMNFID